MRTPLMGVDDLSSLAVAVKLAGGRLLLEPTLGRFFWAAAWAGCEEEAGATGGCWDDMILIQ